MKKFALFCSSAMFLPATAFAQSTGTEATETIVVTGTRNPAILGTVVPDVPKTRSVLTQEFISRQSEGQSVLAIVSNIPGVNFTNTDPYGGGNGNLRIRGFPGNRVAFLWDGLPLNDTGNYAIFGGQQMTPELIDQVSVNLGTTDVDSPTPSAAGGVISYRTRLPSREMNILAKGSVGTFDFRRAFVLGETGNLTSFGTRGFIAVERQRNDKFKGPGENSKFQVNGRLYQPLGSGGDFVSFAAHHNRNRNHQYNSGTARDYVTDRDFDNIEDCARDAPTSVVRDNDNDTATTNSTVSGLAPTTCTNYFGLRLNPSTTQNVRTALKLTLMDGLTLTADPSYFWTVANGGGTAIIAENDSRLRGDSTAVGVDLNGDGDFIDIGNASTSTTAPNPAGIRVYSPQNTRTKRFTFLSSLIWEATPTNRFRVAYTFDRGRHRQTGEYGRIDMDGDPFSWFGGKYSHDDAVLGLNGEPIQLRNRLSYAMLNQVSGEYFGQFLDTKLKVSLGVRAPFFERELNQYCFTSNGTQFFGGNTIGGSNSTRAAQGAFRVTAGNPYCTDQSNPVLPGGTVANPTAGEGTLYFAPFERTVKYSPILPSVGASYQIAGPHSVYASFGKNFSSPSTDSLYRSVVIDPKPEFTDSYEAGYRFRSGRLQAQLSGYRTDYKNRIVSAQDLDPESPTFGSTIDRNAGKGQAWGAEAQASFKPEVATTLYAYGSYTDTEILEDILRTATATSTNSPCPASVPVGSTCQVVDVLTGGNEFVETPKWQFGGRAQRAFGPLSLGVQMKYVGKRWSTDDNGRTLATTTGSGQTAGQPFILTGPDGQPIDDVPIAPNGRTNSYTILDMDAVLDLGFIGFKQGRLRINANNVLNKYYFGNISTQSTLSGTPRFSVGSPRTIQATLSFDY